MDGRHPHESVRLTKSGPRSSFLVTVVLYAWNEEAYIGPAIASILEQDFEPLEIVLSDDGSTDDTFEIMKAMVAAYEGPHRVLLNRNNKNLGIGSQINAAVRMTTGRLVVLANGDDISHPDRISRTVAMWQAQDESRAMGVWSALRQIDENGEPLSRVMDCQVDLSSLEAGVKNRFGGVHAASLAVDRSVFEAFGPLPDNLILEDCALFARAVLLGPVRYSERPWVDYRVHSENISQSYQPAPFEEWRARHRQRVLWQTSEGIKAYAEILRDLHQKPSETWDRREIEDARWSAMTKLLEYRIRRDAYQPGGDKEWIRPITDLLKLIGLMLRLRIKRMLPFLQKRSDRWHYAKVMAASRGRE